MRKINVATESPISNLEQFHQHILSLSREDEISLVLINGHNMEIEQINKWIVEIREVFEASLYWYFVR
ncbi:MAG: hypothetical protein R3B45_15220 [Bdellovibrionota bacterium]